MAHEHGEADGEGGGSLEVGSLAVAGGEHGEDEHEGDEKLHAETLGGGQRIVDRGQTQVVIFDGVGDGEKEARTQDGTDKLRADIEDRLDQADTAGHQETTGNGRVDVAAANVADCPHHCSHAETERKGDGNHGGLVRGLVCEGDTGTATHEHQEQGSYDLGNHGHIGLGVSQIF